MNCAAPHCQGHVSDLFCSDHGEICTTCGIPTIHSREDKNCGRCGAIADGVTCEECQSPWVYMRFYADRLWRCRVCVSNIIKTLNLEETAEALVLRLEESVVRAKAEQEEKEAKAKADLEAAKEARILKRKKKEEQPDNLFTLKSGKKKKS